MPVSVDIGSEMSPETLDYLTRLLEPVVEPMIEKELEKLEVQGPVEVNLTEMSKEVNLSKNKFKDILYRNREELDGVYVIYPTDGEHWRFARKPFIAWWENNFEKVR